MHRLPSQTNSRANSFFSRPVLLNGYAHVNTQRVSTYGVYLICSVLFYSGAQVRFFSCLVISLSSYYMIRDPGVRLSSVQHDLRSI